MNKPSKCKNCQWYGKPYWSIINPCDNCPNENNYKTIITIDREPLFKEVLTEEEIKKAMTDKSIFQITLEEKDKEIERLNKECDTYMKIAAKKDNIIDELEKWLNEYYETNRKWYNNELTPHDMEYYESDYRSTEFMIVKFLRKLKELKEKSD